MSLAGETLQVETGITVKPLTWQHRGNVSSARREQIPVRLKDFSHGEDVLQTTNAPVAAKCGPEVAAKAEVVRKSCGRKAVPVQVRPRAPFFEFGLSEQNAPSTTMASSKSPGMFASGPFLDPVTPQLTSSLLFPST